MSIELSDVGGLVSEGQINRIEKDLEIKLPEEYRSFLTHTNGGKPFPAYFPVAGHKTIHQSKIELIFGLGRADRQTNIDWNYKNLIGILPNYHFPIAITPEEDMVTMSLGHLDQGRIYFWIRAEYNVTGDNEAYYVAGSFTKFLEAIYALS